MKKRIFIDMDHTSFDYDTAYNRIKREYPYIEFPQSKFGFFANLEPMPGFIKAFKQLEIYYDVWFLTRPSIYNLNSYSEKASCIEKYLGQDQLNRTVYACNKSIVKGDFLIDDSIRDGQLDFDGEFIQFGVAPFENWNKITRYLLRIIK